MEGDVCRRMGCTKCCQETEMELASRDIKRLESAGYRGFYSIYDDARRMQNINGRCIFLDEDGDCKVYGLRPEGCRLYPLVMRLPEREALLDDQCPYADQFLVSSEDRILLEDLIDRLIAEGP